MVVSRGLHIARLKNILKIDAPLIFASNDQDISEASKRRIRKFFNLKDDADINLIAKELAKDGNNDLDYISYSDDGIKLRYDIEGGKGYKYYDLSQIGTGTDEDFLKNRPHFRVSLKDGTTGKDFIRKIPSEAELEVRLARQRISVNADNAMLKVLNSLEANEIEAAGFDVIETGEFREAMLEHAIKEEVAANSWMRVLGKTGAKLAIGFSATVEGAFIIIPIIVDILSRPAGPFGKFNTTYNQTMITEISPADVAAWNSNHDQQHQIAANTTVAQGQGNNTLSNVATLQYKDANDVDPQFGVQVSLNALSTPFLRLDSNQAKVDPWLDGVDENGKDRDTAVIHMEVTNLNSGDPQKDTFYQLARIQAQEMGFSSLSADDRFEKPVYSVNSIRNTTSNGTIYARNMNGSVFSATNNGLKVGNLEGLFLNSGQDVSLDVSVPATNANGVEKTGGMAVTFSAEDSNGDSAHLLAVNSVTLRNLYEHGKGNDEKHVVPSYLYSKFDSQCHIGMPAGSNCKLALAVGGNSNSKQTGKLLISDAYSKTTSIPVYLNYHMIVEPMGGATINPAAINTTFTIKIANAGKDNYQQLGIANLPDGITEVSNSCNNGLTSGQSCSITYDAGMVDQGNYNLQISGLKASANGSQPGIVKLNPQQAKAIPDSDSENFRLEVQEAN